MNGRGYAILISWVTKFEIGLRGMMDGIAKFSNLDGSYSCSVSLTNHVADHLGKKGAKN